MQQKELGGSKNLFAEMEKGTRAHFRFNGPYADFDPFYAKMEKMSAREGGAFYRNKIQIRLRTQFRSRLSAA